MVGDFLQWPKTASNFEQNPVAEDSGDQQWFLASFDGSFWQWPTAKRMNCEKVYTRKRSSNSKNGRFKKEKSFYEIF